MGYQSIRGVIFALLVLFGGYFVCAREMIAIHPLQGGSDSAEMADIFFEELVRAVPRVPGHEGAFIPFIIDLDGERPSDVPPGGFPPFICPPSSLTGGAPFAITGEVGEAPDSPGDFNLRVYLWRMEGGRLLMSDMISAYDRESSAESLPFILAYLFSEIAEPPPPAPPEQHWLYLGIRGGGGDSVWGLAGGDLVKDHKGEKFMNANGAIQLVGNLLPLLSVQLEANINNYFSFSGNFADDPGNSTMHELTGSLLFMLNLRNDPIKVGIYAGPYYYWPFMEIKDGDNAFPEAGADFGLSFGITVGRKLGPGFLFVDGRFNRVMDLNDGRLKNFPHGTTINLGYEWGFIQKK
jgi:hypothetical protein